jgi:hypothetical protein
MSQVMPASLTELEAIERDAWLDMFAASPAPFTQGAGLASRRFGEAAGFAIRAAPTIQFNRAQGVGLSGVSDGTLDGILVWLAGACGAAWSLQVIDQPGEVLAPARLELRGLVAAGAWTKFVRDPAQPPAARTDLSIQTVGPAQAMDFGATVAAGFGAPPPFAGWAAGLVGRPRWTTYVAYDGRTPAAAAALYLQDGLAWLGLGCCLPAWRGRGAQSALLARRIADAGAARARAVVTETGSPPPGEEDRHPSYRNIRRAGFAPAYERINYRPAAQLGA